MSSDLLNTLLANLWAVILVVLLFGGSIFVHELGHFLAARRRGVQVERFSIGFGPALWSRRGRDGVEYRLSAFPLGGYVMLPQLADLGALEGEGEAAAEKLPPVTYATKMLVFVAGAVCNILFAFALACIVWVIGQPVSSGFSSTTVAEIMPTIKVAGGEEVVSPAVRAGLQSGDEILAVDGFPVATFHDIVERLVLSSGWNDRGERQTVFTLRRAGQTVDVPIKPVISGSEKVRMVGFTTVAKLVIGRVQPDSPAARAGILPEDQIVAVDGSPVLTLNQLVESLRAPADGTIEMAVLRDGVRRVVTVGLPAGTSQDRADIGVALKSGVVYTHPSPFAQISDSVVKIFRTLGALLNPRSDIGLSHLSGPIGIISSFVDVSRLGLPFALWFTILVNVNLAIFNLLPIPVLDGGQMLFATIGRLRGRSLPLNFIMTTQSVFIVLLFSMVIYVSFFDVRRIVRDATPERPVPASPATCGP